MEVPKIDSRLRAVEAKAARLERWLKFTAFAWLATAALFLASAWLPIPQAAAQARKGTTDVVRARQFVVVDDKGAERIVIAAPLPEANPPLDVIEDAMKARQFLAVNRVLVDVGADHFASGGTALHRNLSTRM